MRPGKQNEDASQPHQTPRTKGYSGCYSCGSSDHRVSDCPNPKRSREEVDHEQEDKEKKKQKQSKSKNKSRAANDLPSMRRQSTPLFGGVKHDINAPYYADRASSKSSHDESDSDSDSS